MKRIVVLFFVFFFFIIISHSQTYNILYDFNTGSNYDSWPYGCAITDSGNVFYGMTTYNTQNSTNSQYGQIFRINKDGSNYELMHTFPEKSNDGNVPVGKLALADSFLFGITYKGGSYGYGTIFKIKTDNSGFKILRSFFGGDDGMYPLTSLTKVDSFLYGMTFTGGLNNRGIIYKIKTDGTKYRKIYDFVGDSTDGAHPMFTTLASDGSVLYGITSHGGNFRMTTDQGVLFKINTDGSGYKILHFFDGPPFDGANPTGSLILSDSLIYGITSEGGNWLNGEIYKIKKDGSDFVQLHSFKGGSSDGSVPLASMTKFGDTLFGMTMNGGDRDLGVIYRMNLDGSHFSIIHSFTGELNDGRYPRYSNELMILNGGDIYGMVSMGGISDLGMIFKYKNPNTDSCGPQSFEYQVMSDPFAFSLNSSAKQNNSTIRLTTATKNVVGSMFTKNPLNVLNGFNTSFSFRFTQGVNDLEDGSPPGADGIAFVIQATNPAYYGSTGGGIGFAGISNSIAIEFDSYRDENDLGDPNGSHVAIFSNGVNANSADHRSSALKAYTSEIPLLKADSTTYYAEVSYNYQSKKLILYFDTTGLFLSPVIVLDSLDLFRLLDLIENDKAYLGFTASTGASYQNTDLLSWAFCSKRTDSITPVRELHLPADQNIDNDYEISPNPASDRINISFKGVNYSGDNFHIKILNSLGIVMKKYDRNQFSDENSLIVSTKDFPAGVYFCSFNYGTNKITKSFIVVK